jgi:hypothetical protein
VRWRRAPGPGALALSYGAAAFLAIAGLAAAAADAAHGGAEPAAGRPTRARALWPARLGVLATAAGVAVALAFGVRLLGGAVRAMLTALAIHRDTYTAPAATRPGCCSTPSTSPLAAPGRPAPWLRRRARAPRALGLVSPPTAAFGAAVVAGIVGLTFTGFSRGEVGRI